MRIIKLYVRSHCCISPSVYVPLPHAFNVRHQGQYPYKIKTKL
jgi:hypothetical protein